MKNNKRPIGVFDSGLGGLTVVKSITRLMPNEDIIYFGDTAHVPYGTRTREQIMQYVMNDVRFLNLFDIKAIVFACNTADAVARTAVEEKYPLPVFGVVSPAARAAALATKNNRVGIICTNATVASGAYEREIKRFNSEISVFSEACPLLVPLVEDGRFQKGDVVLEGALTEYLGYMREKDVDTLVLGCTHYPLIRDNIERIYPGLRIINPSEEIVLRISEILNDSDMLASGEARAEDSIFYASDLSENFVNMIDKIFEGHPRVEFKNLDIDLID